MKWFGFLALAAVVGNAASQSCSYGGIDYSALTNSQEDYACQSDFYQNAADSGAVRSAKIATDGIYEFVFNVCQQLVYSDGDCITGSGSCERLSGTKTATDVYGMTGQTCMFGGSMTSRIYQVCSSGATTPFSSIVHESYYDCEVFIALHSQAACSGGNFPPSPPGPGPPAPPGPPGNGGQTGKVTKADVGMAVCLLFFLGGGAYFAVGGYMNHRKGEVGYDRVPHKEFWGSLPGLIKDGFEFTKGKVMEKLGRGGDGNYTDLK
eukprot:gene18418-376_t